MLEESKDAQASSDAIATAEGFNLVCKVRGDRKVMGLSIDVPKVYPLAPVEVQILDALQVTNKLVEAI